MSEYTWLEIMYDDYMATQYDIYCEAMAEQYWMEYAGMLRRYLILQGMGL